MAEVFHKDLSGDDLHPPKEHGNEAHNPDFLAVDGSNSPTADINWGARKITNLADPVNNQDAATKKYVSDNFAPVSHGNEHEAGGSDPVDVRGLQGGWLTADIEANRPAAGTKDRYFYATDTGKLYYDNGTSWIEITPTPKTHASTHEEGGSDALDIRGLQGAWLMADTEANRPAAGTKDRYFYATDTDKLYYDNGSSWVEMLGGGGLSVHGNDYHDPDMLPLETSNTIDAYISSNKWLSVLTSGIVKFPRQSACKAYLSASQTIASATWTKVQLDTTEYDVQGEFDTANYRFTATEAGKYLVIGQIRIQSMTGQKPMGVRISKNGGSQAEFICYTGYTGHSSVAISTVVDLAAGDYIELFAYQNSGASKDLFSDSYYTFMAIHKLS
ncbi:MAG: hypothetical protein DRG83_00090 [Deltaproteobacteria bacterium]|nr:MAG: hypothetical protein DRG83_00090 [Deltaproteobacteria bacterium]